MTVSFAVYWVRSHAPSIRSHRGIKVVWPDFQPMRVPEEPVCVHLFRQKPVFTSLHLKSPVHVHRLWTVLVQYQISSHSLPYFSFHSRFGFYLLWCNWRSLHSQKILIIWTNVFSPPGKMIINYKGWWVLNKNGRNHLLRPGKHNEDIGLGKKKECSQIINDDIFYHSTWHLFYLPKLLWLNKILSSILDLVCTVFSFFLHFNHPRSALPLVGNFVILSL